MSPTIVLSPAKSLSPERAFGRANTAPRLLGEANHLASICRRLNAVDLARLMKISDALADLNAARFASFDDALPMEKGWSAGLAFDGDTYQALEYASLDERDKANADCTLRILSGLYGLLRPSDAIQPYRLEMGRLLETTRGRGLYRYWGSRITRLFEDDAATAPLLLKLASEEYANAVAWSSLSQPVVSPAFLENRNGTLKTISFSAKKARGAMARWAIETRPASPEAIRGFT